MAASPCSVPRPASRRCSRSSSDPDEATGARIVLRSLEGPIKQIAENAGLEGGVVVEKVRSLKNPAEGLNAATGEYEDLVEAGIIDAAKVTRSALQNAASIAALFLTTEAVITDAPEKGARRRRAAAWATWTSDPHRARSVSQDDALTVGSRHRTGDRDETRERAGAERIAPARFRAPGRSEVVAAR